MQLMSFHEPLLVNLLLHPVELLQDALRRVSGVRREVQALLLIGRQPRKSRSAFL